MITEDTEEEEVQEKPARTGNYTCPHCSRFFTDHGRYLDHVYRSHP